jgi:hypothetical protein
VRFAGFISTKQTLLFFYGAWHGTCSVSFC